MEPSLLNYFTSNHFILFAIRQIIVDRIAAVVTPRFPQNLALLPTAIIRIPILYLLFQNIAHLLRLISPLYTTDELHLDHDKLSQDLAPVLYNLYKLLCLTSIVDVFIRCIENRNWASAVDYSSNIFEWGIILHFQPTYHVAPVALLHISQVATMQVCSLFHLMDYQLIPTTFFGIVNIVHLLYNLRFGVISFHPIYLISKLAEVGVLMVVALVGALYGLTLLLTGFSSDNVTRHPFLRGNLPSLNEEFGFAIFKLGQACMETTQSLGLRNEVTSVRRPLGTYFEESQFQRRLREESNRSGFSNLADFSASEIGQGRDLTESVKHNIVKLIIIWKHLMSAVGNLWRSLMYGDVKDLRKSRCSSPFTYKPLPETISGANRIIWDRFQKCDFPNDSEEEDCEFIPSSSDESDAETDIGDFSDIDKVPLIPESLLLERDLIDSETLQKQLLLLDKEKISNFGVDGVTWEDCAIRQAASSVVPGSTLTRRRFQDFLQSKLTKPFGSDASEYQLLNSFLRPSSHRTHQNQEKKDREFIHLRRQETGVRSEAEYSRLCVVCQYEQRNIILKPCNCLSICDTCRELMASRHFSNCPCCRQTVSGYCKIFEP